MRHDADSAPAVTLAREIAQDQNRTITPRKDNDLYHASFLGTTSRKRHKSTARADNRMDWDVHRRPTLAAKTA